MEIPRVFHWSDEFSTAVTFLDDEHREIIRRYRELVCGLQRDADLPQFSKGLGALLRETRAHFLHEEKVMRNIQYPDYRRHRAAHKQLLSDFSDFIQSIENGFTGNELPALTEYFRHWFMSHLEEYDVKLRHYLDRNDKPDAQIAPTTVLIDRVVGGFRRR